MAPLTHVLTDLRRGVPLLVIATLAGGAVGGFSAFREGKAWSASAGLLVTARAWERRGAPVRPAERGALLDPEVLAPAEAAAQAREAIAAALASHQTPEGVFLPGACWLVSARKGA